jgi:hypothetical protein
VATTDGLAPISALPVFQRIIKKDGAEMEEKFAKTKPVQKEIDYFREKVKELKSPEDLFKNRRLMQFVLSAYSMDDELQYMGRMKKILLSKLTDVNSLAQKMADPRFREINQDLLMGDFGVNVLKSSSMVEKLVDRYITNEYEKDLGNQNPALREASYFLRKIGTVNSSLDILGDKILRSVTTYTLGLPDEIAFQSIQRQQQLIDKRIDVTKFKIGADSSSTKVTAAKANADVTAIESQLSVVSKASTQVKAILDRLQDLKDDYDRLNNIQDPGGPYAGEIPVQEAAVPELVRMRGLMGSAAAATGSIASAMTRMNELVDLASDSANAGSLSSYKTEFETLRAGIHTALGDATYLYDDTDADSTATAQNLLDGSLAGPLSVQIDSTGTTIELRTHDLSGLLNTIDAAGAAFQSVSGSGDTSNLQAAQSGLDSSTTSLTVATTALKADEASFLAAMGGVTQFAATLNTDEIYPGYQSASDAATRTTKILGLLSQIRGVASESFARAGGDDRSDLNTKYADLVAQVSTLINTPGAGLDNLIAGGDQSYELINSAYATVRGRDLNTSVLAALNAGDVSSVANASAMMATFTSTIDPTIAQTQRELAADLAGLGLAVGTLDSRAAVDSAYKKLSTDMADLVKGAEVDKKDAKGAVVGKLNLLSSTQPDITFKVETSGHTITIPGLRNFDTDVTQTLAAGAALLPSGLGDPSGALAALDETMFNARRALSQLNSAARTLDLERSTAKAAGNAAAAAESASGSDGIDATDFAIKFVMRFLAKKDAEASSSTGTSLMGSLIYPIGQGGQSSGSGISFVQVGAGMNFLV